MNRRELLRSAAVLPLAAALPAAVEPAVQVCWANLRTVHELMGDAIGPDNPVRLTRWCASACGETPPYIEIFVPGVPHGWIAQHGDWIERKSDGGFEVYTA